MNKTVKIIIVVLVMLGLIWLAIYLIYVRKPNSSLNGNGIIITPGPTYESGTGATGGTGGGQIGGGG